MPYNIILFYNKWETTFCITSASKHSDGSVYKKVRQQAMKETESLAS